MPQKQPKWTIMISPGGSKRGPAAKPKSRPSTGMLGNWCQSEPIDGMIQAVPEINRR